MLGVVPRAGVCSKVAEGETRRSKGTVSIVAGDEHAGVSEANDISESIASSITDETDMLLNTPTVTIAKVLEDESGLWSKGVTKTDYTFLSEPDYICGTDSFDLN